MKQLPLPLDCVAASCEGDTIGPVGGAQLDPEGVPSCPFCGVPVDEMDAAVLTFRYGELVSYAHTVKNGDPQHHRRRR